VNEEEDTLQQDTLGVLELARLDTSQRRAANDQKLQEQQAHQLDLQLQLLTATGGCASRCGTGYDAARSSGGTQKLPKLTSSERGPRTPYSFGGSFGRSGAFGAEYSLAPCSGSASRMLRRLARSSSRSDFEWGTANMLAGALVQDDKLDGLQASTECQGLQSERGEKGELVFRISPRPRKGRRLRPRPRAETGPPAELGIDGSVSCSDSSGRLSSPSTPSFLQWEASLRCLAEAQPLGLHG